ncbi:MAG: hypothetical protein ACYC0V_20040 [Armatimonadota bacterium]
MAVFNIPMEGYGQSMSTKQTSLEKAIAARLDIYGEAAMRQPNGASYEFFADLIPPIRYTVNPEFKYYPIVLGLAGGEHKARLVSNGSAVNARANEPVIWLDVGTPITFIVGGGGLFGDDLSRLDGPRYAKGYLPIVETIYREGDALYREEVFAGVSEPFGLSAACFVRFSLSDGKRGRIAAKVASEGQIIRTGSLLTNAEGKALVWFGKNWTWDSATGTLAAPLTVAKDACLVIFTEPIEFHPDGPLTSAVYNAERGRSVRYWDGQLARGSIVEAPEPRVNECRKALQIGSMVIRKGNMMNYGTQNFYERLFEAECDDAVMSFLLYGYADDTREMIPPLMAYWQQGILFHDAAFKLQTLSQVYWLTKDADFLRSQKAEWTAAIDKIMQGIDPKTGLLPRENYCGDIETQVFSLNSNANSWRGLRDFAVVLDEIGEKELAERVSIRAKEYRKVILDAVAKSVRKDVDPPFIPIALFGEEEPYETLTETRMGSYWDLMIPYVLGSGVLGDDSEETGWALDYLHRRGGLFMGMIRFHMATTDDLYGLRYMLTLLRRDDADRALTSFYGKMAQGFTQDTYIGGEVHEIRSLTPFGRCEHQPPNSASNAYWMWSLRYLMVQDWDIDDDGRPDTLRLMFATPRRWLEDGKTIKAEKLPTAFGTVSVQMVSHLADGEIIASVTMPTHTPIQTLISARVPDAWVVTGARIGRKTLPVDDKGTVDITGFRGKVTVRFEVKQSEHTIAK